MFLHKNLTCDQTLKPSVETVPMECHVFFNIPVFFLKNVPYLYVITKFHKLTEPCYGIRQLKE